LWAAIVEYFGCGCGDDGDQAEAGAERGSEEEYILDYRVSSSLVTIIRLIPTGNSGGKDTERLSSECHHVEGS
jgi:hypothetical protein